MKLTSKRQVARDWTPMGREQAAKQALRRVEKVKHRVGGELRATHGCRDRRWAVVEVGNVMDEDSPKEGAGVGDLGEDKEHVGVVVDAVQQRKRAMRRPLR